MLKLRLSFLVPTLTLTLARVAGARADVSSFASIEHLQSLRAEVQHHDELYFREAAPLISDAAYDQLKCELTELEQKFAPVGSVGEARAQVGDDRTGSRATFHHRLPMLSLDKSYSEGELRSFYARLVRLTGRENVTCVVEPKFDGLAVSVTYEKGKLVRAVTRGNGEEGDDITSNVLAIDSIRRELRSRASDGSAISVPDMIELRGEIYLPLAEFARINEEREGAGETPFAHPRNLAAGTMKQLDPALVAERHLAAVFYTWGALEPAMALPKSQQEFHRCVRAWGLPGVDNFEVVRSADEMWAAVKSFERARLEFPAPTDGLVVKLDSVEGQHAAGASAHAPRWAMAYKFAPDLVESQLKSITLQVGRTGVLTPVAELSPVKIGGSVVSRASLHSVGEVSRRDIRIGDTLYLERSGEVIPNVSGVDLCMRPADSRPFEFPTRCPSCGTDVTREIGGTVLRCTNRACPAQLRRRVQHFASDSCVRIPGLGPETIDSLIAHAGLKSIPDLYRLRRPDLVERVPGFSSEKSCDRLLAAIEQSKQTELWRIIFGLGIPQVGAVAAKELARHFPDLAAFGAAASDRARLIAQSGESLRATMVGSLVAYFSDPQNCSAVSELVALGVGGKAAREISKENISSADLEPAPQKPRAGIQEFSPRAHFIALGEAAGMSVDESGDGGWSRRNLW